MKLPSRPVRICALLLLALPLFSGCSKQAKFERHLKRAEDYFAGKDYKKAEIEYLSALRLQSTNRTAFRRLATIYYDQGRAGQALLYLQGVCALDPEDNDARVKMGGLLLRGDNQKARAQAYAVLDREPTNAEAILLLADAARTPKDIQEALQRILPFQEQAGNRASFQLALNGLYSRQTNSQAADGALRKAFALEPESPLVLKALGEFHWQHGDLTNADQAFRKATAVSPPSSRIPLRWAEFKFDTGSPKEAKEILQQVTRRTPESPDAWLRLARIAFMEENYQECNDLLKKVTALDPTNDEPRLWQARMKQVQGKSQEALKVLEDLQRDYPRVATVEFQLALSHYQNQDLPKAAAGLRRALSLDPSLGQAKLLLAEIDLHQGDSGTAISSLRDLIKRQPNLDRAYFLLANAYNMEGRFDEALALFAGLEKRFPTNSGVAFMKGVTLRRMDRKAEARKAFQAASELAPNDFLSVSALVELDLAEKSYPPALLRVRRVLAKDPRSAQAQFLEAKILLLQTNLNDAEIAFQKTIELDPSAGPAYAALTQIYLAGNRKPQAIEKLQQAIVRNPKETKAMMLLAQIHDQGGEYEKASKYYEDVLKVTPQFVPALNNLAYLLSVKLGKNDEAFGHASKAREVAPQESRVAGTLGWIVFQRRDYGRALALLQESAAKEPDHPEIQFHLGMAFYMMGQEAPARAAFKRALELSQDFPGRNDAQGRLALLDADPRAVDATTIARLQKLVQEQPDDLPALLRLGGAYERSGAPEKARQVYENARKVNPNSVPVLVQLAQLYSSALKDSKLALAVARDARKLAPEDPRIAHMLGRVAVQEGDPVWASSLLQQSAQKLPNDPEIPYDLALAWYASGRVSEAADTMRRARQLGSVPGVAFAHDQEAQWFLALIDYQAFPEKRLAAEAQVNQLLMARPDYLPARMVSALIQEQRGRIPEARAAYEKILERNLVFAPARKQLAGLYTDRLGDQQKAQDYASKAREVLNDDAELGKILGKIAYRRDDYRNAVRFLQESSRKMPKDAEGFFFLGMAHYGLKEKMASKQALDEALELAPDAPFALEAKRTLASLK